jgi:exodeoxyribonuclease VII large subunit
MVPDAAAVREGLRETPARLARALRGMTTRRRERIDERLVRLGRTLERRLAPARQSVDLATGRLERSVRNLIDRRRREVRAGAGRLDALSPLATLRRGYAVARTADGKVLRTTADFEVGTEFVVRVSDGRVAAETLRILDEE